MKRTLAGVALTAALVTGVLRHPKHALVIHAQTLPYTLTVVWTASTDTNATYNCYLDGALQVTGTSPTALTCSFPVSALGQHTVAVTAVDPTFVPSESAQSAASVTFTLTQTPAPKNVKVK